MSTTAWIIVAVVVIILIFIVVKILKSCLPKIIIGLIILAALAYLAYKYLIK
jgi:hypothetical protein